MMKNNAGIKKAGCLMCQKQACIKIGGEPARCQKHFMEHLEKKMRSAIREFFMIKPGEHVCVALSGGKDSTVLLHMLTRLKERLPMRISAILIDEGIAGYRAKTIAVAKKECKKLGVPLHIVSFEKEVGSSLDSIIKKRGGDRAHGACAYCGVFRRTLLSRAARRIGADKLALGHNLDDAAQTVLLNMFRNEPERLLRFGPSDGEWESAAIGKEGKKMVRRIQPLIRCYEKEIALWAIINGIGINFASCPYANEAMRQEARTMLNSIEEKYPGTKARLFSSFLRMRAWMRKGADGELGAKGIGACAKCGEPSSGQLCASCKMIETFAKK